MVSSFSDCGRRRSSAGSWRTVMQAKEEAEFKAAATVAILKKTNERQEQKREMCFRRRAGITIVPPADGACRSP